MLKRVVSPLLSPKSDGLFSRSYSSLSFQCPRSPLIPQSESKSFVSNQSFLKPQPDRGPTTVAALTPNFEELRVFIIQKLKDYQQEFASAYAHDIMMLTRWSDQDNGVWSIFEKSKKPRGDFEPSSITDYDKEAGVVVSKIERVTNLSALFNIIVGNESVKSYIYRALGSCIDSEKQLIELYRKDQLAKSHQSEKDSESAFRHKRSFL